MLTEKEKYVILKILADGKSHGLRELCAAIGRKVYASDIAQAIFVRWVFGENDLMLKADGKVHSYQYRGGKPDGKVKNSSCN